MAELTDNQKKVLSAIENGAHTTDSISKESGVAKGSITAVANSLIKKGLVAKNEDGSYAASNTEPAPIPSADETLATEQAEQPTDLTVIDVATKRLAILIPYLKSEAAGEELKYALRAWEQNFKEDFRVIVIGDKEDWFSPEVEHIPHEPHLIKEVCNCPAPSLIRNPQADSTHKIFTAIAALKLTGDIIYSNDDIFLIAPTTLEELKVLKVFHQNLNTVSLDDKSLYAQNTRLAGKRLQKEDLPAYRYGTHTPVVFDAEKLIEVIEKYEALDNGYPIESMYFNEVHPEARPMVVIDGGINDRVLASVYRSNVDPKLMETIFQKRKFINCNTRGWKSVKNLFEKEFSTPSRFEK